MNRIADRIKFFDTVSPSQMENFLKPYYTFEYFVKVLNALSKEHGELTGDQLLDRSEDNRNLANIYMEYDATQKDKIKDELENGVWRYFDPNKLQDPKTEDLNFDIDLLDKDESIRGPLAAKYYVDPKLYGQLDDAGNVVKNSKGQIAMSHEDRENYLVDKQESQEAFEKEYKAALLHEHSPYRALRWDINDLRNNGASVNDIIAFLRKSSVWKDINLKLKEMYFPKGFPWIGTRSRDSIYQQVYNPDTQQIETKIVRNENSNVDGTLRDNPIIMTWKNHKNEFEAALKNSNNQDTAQLSMWLKKFMAYVDQYNTELQKTVHEDKSIHMDERRYDKLQMQLANLKKQLSEYIINDNDNGQAILSAIEDDIQNLNELKSSMTAEDYNIEMAYLTKLVKTTKLYISIQNELDQSKNEIIVDRGDLSDKDRHQYTRIFYPMEIYYRLFNDITEHIRQLQSDQQHDKNVAEEEKINNPYNAHYMFLELENIYRAEKRIPLNQIEYKKMASRLAYKTASIKSPTTNFLYYGNFFMNKLLAQVNYLFLDDEEE